MALKNGSVGIFRSSAMAWFWKEQLPVWGPAKEEDRVERVATHLVLFFLVNRGCFGVPLHHSCTLSVLEPQDQMHLPSDREGALLSSWLGGQEPSSW